MTVYNKASLVLAESPAYKAGKIQPYYPLTPDVSFDFTRATSATRVNADGNIEKETQNLLLQSNQFDTTWGSATSTLTSGQSGYDGSNDAWKIAKNQANAQINQSYSDTSVKTLSIYAKADTLNWIAIVGASGSIGYFDLVNGVVGTTGGSVIDTNIESAGNGWWRCSVSSAATTSSVTIYPADADNDISGTSGSVYIQDAQLEQGLVARNYQETTTAAFYGGITDNIPRLDYTDSSCPALLLEPQRTNSLPHSENFNAWAKQSGVSIDVNTTDTLSPEGKYNSCKITSTSGTTGLYAIRSGGFETNTATRSVYLKGENGGETLVLKDGSGFGGTKNITLTTEWVRYELKTTADGNNYQGFFIDDVPTDSAVYAYGAQMETGSYATSYIPTYGSAVTRNVDRNLLSTIPVDTSNNYTIFMDLVRISDNEHTTKWFDLRGNDGTYIQAYMISGGGRFRIFFRGIVDGTQSLTDENNPQKDEQYKFAIVRTDSSLKLFANGALIGTKTDKIPDELDYYAELNENRINNHMLFPTALTDQEAIDLTTI